MSFDALAWAAKCRVTRATDKLILLALADRHNPESGTAYPSIAWLAEFSSLDRKTVMAALTRLECAKLIADSGERAGKTLQVKAYRLALETVPKTEQYRKRNSTVFPAKQSQKRDTDTIKEPVPSEAKASSGRAKFPAPLGVSDEQWEAFCAQRKKKINARSYLLLCNKLHKLAEDGWPPGDMIDLAIERGWETQFAPRTFKNDRPDTAPVAEAFNRVFGQC